MKILICDDDKIVLENLKNKLKKVLRNVYKEQTIIIDTFSDVNGLYDYIYDSNIIPDAVIMDVCLGDDMSSSGIEVAKKIKEEYMNINIIFCTGNKESIADVFEVGPLYVLFKPVDDKKLKDAMAKLYSYIVHDRSRCMTIKAVRGIHRIMIGDVDYLESQGRYVKIHINGESLLTINKLENVKEMFGTDFLQCHKSFVVNYNKIKAYEDTKITLYNDMVVPVSRYFRKDIKDNLLNRI